jgi:hypothetical protein
MPVSRRAKSHAGGLIAGFGLAIAGIATALVIHSNARSAVSTAEVGHGDYSIAIDHGSDQVAIHIDPNKAGVVNSVVARSARANTDLRLKASFGMLDMEMGPAPTCVFHQRLRGMYVCKTYMMFMHGIWTIHFTITSAGSTTHESVLDRV